MKNISKAISKWFFPFKNFSKAVFTGLIIHLAFIASAQSPTAPALNFNIFVKNNFTAAKNETEGPVAAGGSLLLAGSYVMASKSSGTFKVGNVPIGLLVGGKIVYSSGNQTYVNNGYVKVADATGSAVWYVDNNGASSNLRITTGKFDATPSINLQTSASKLGVSAKVNPVFQSGLVDFNTAFTALQANAKSMSAYPTLIEFTNPNGDKKGTTIPSVLTNGQIKLNLKAGTNVMNVTGAELNSVTGNITFNNSPDASRSLIINVNAGGAFKWSVWNQAGIGFPNCPYIIYNFYNTTNLQIEGNSTVEGTVFAPFADINKTSNQSNIEGQVIGLSFYHGAGANRYGIFIPKLAVADADGDGVADVDDNYPNDITKAFDNHYPGKGFSTLLFEDLWPYTGDYDFNDLVIDYKFNTVTNAAGNVAEIIYSFLPKAAGASFRDGFAFQLDGISSDKILSVTGSKMSAGWSRLNSNGTEEGHKSGTNIIVFDDVYKVFNGVPSGASAINTFSTAPHYSADTITISLKFVANGIPYASLGSAKFNPYLIVDQKRTKEIHLSDRTPSDKMDRALFGLGDDASSAATGKYYITKHNLPWALNIVNVSAYPQEKVDFTSVYLMFIKWAISGGKTNADWYLNISGNRDDSKIYKY